MLDRSATIDRWLTRLHVGVFFLLAVGFGFAGLSLASCGLIGGPPSIFPSGLAIFGIGAAAYQLSKRLEQGRGYLPAAVLCAVVYILLFAWYLSVFHPERGELIPAAVWWALKTSVFPIELVVLLLHRRLRRRLSEATSALQSG